MTLLSLSFLKLMSAPALPDIVALELGQERRKGKLSRIWFFTRGIKEMQRPRWPFFQRGLKPEGGMRSLRVNLKTPNQALVQFELKKRLL